MSKDPIPTSRWQRLLDSLSRAYRRWPCDVESCDADGHVIRADAGLDELYFDPASDRIHVRVGRRWLGVSHPTGLSLCSGDNDERALEVESRTGTLRLRFHSAG